MIGQTNLHEVVNKMLYETGDFPKFVIFIGPKGSGKKTFVKEHFDGIYLENNKIDSVRKMINLVYKVSNATFIMPDADDMSTSARNALLKIIEECPNNNYFIMTLEDVNNTLDTIKSRASIFYMDRYTSEEIYAYAKLQTNYTLHDDEYEIIKELCETPGDVNILGEYPIEFCDYINLVIDNITEVSISNVFKISNKIAIKDDSTGYDLRLFWKAFQWACLDRSSASTDEDNTFKYGSWSIITSKYLRQLKNKGVNKQMLFDNWILSIRDMEGD